MGGFFNKMKIAFYKFFIFIFMIAVFTASGCDSVENATKYGPTTIKGRVISALDSTGISGAYIRLAEYYTTTSSLPDSIGYYFKDNIHMGNTVSHFRVFASHDSFYSDSVNVMLYEWKTATINFKLRPKP